VPHIPLGLPQLALGLTGGAGSVGAGPRHRSGRKVLCRPGSWWQTAHNGSRASTPAIHPCARRSHIGVGSAHRRSVFQASPYRDVAPRSEASEAVALSARAKRPSARLNCVAIVCAGKAIRLGRQHRGRRRMASVRCQAKSLSQLGGSASSPSSSASAFREQHDDERGNVHDRLVRTSAVKPPRLRRAAARP
jgi:hypothetical protein